MIGCPTREGCISVGQQSDSQAVLHLFERDTFRIGIEEQKRKNCTIIIAEKNMNG